MLGQRSTSCFNEASFTVCELQKGERDVTRRKNRIFNVPGKIDSSDTKCIQHPEFLSFTQVFFFLFTLLLITSTSAFHSALTEKAQTVSEIGGGIFAIVRNRIFYA